MNRVEAFWHRLAVFYPRCVIRIGIRCEGRYGFSIVSDNDWPYKPKNLLTGL